MEPVTPTIALTSCQSASIAAHGYDQASQTLAIRFKSGKGATYHYAGISPELYEKFCGANSLGTFFHTHIAGRFQHTKVEPEPEAPAVGTGTLTTGEDKEQTNGVA